MNDQMIHYHIVVHGDVQGVGFRHYTRMNASLYGIAGWVRNRSNGTVEIDAEGSGTNMAVFIEAIKRGNRYSSVDSLDIDKMPDMELHRSFHIADDE